jgi:hypothetical protein
VCIHLQRQKEIFLVASGFPKKERKERNKQNKIHEQFFNSDSQANNNTREFF